MGILLALAIMRLLPVLLPLVCIVAVNLMVVAFALVPHSVEYVAVSAFAFFALFYGIIIFLHIYERVRERRRRAQISN